jgi:hypothetical protein
VIDGERTAILRLVGAVYRRFKAGCHPHLCAFVVLFDNRRYGKHGGGLIVERVLRAEWLA